MSSYVRNELVLQTEIKRAGTIHGLRAGAARTQGNAERLNVRGDEKRSAAQGEKNRARSGFRFRTEGKERPARNERHANRERNNRSQKDDGKP